MWQSALKPETGVGIKSSFSYAITAQRSFVDLKRLISFSMLRSCAGGYHAHSAIGCFVISEGTFLCSVLFAKLWRYFMKYIRKNLKNFLKNETIIFFLVFLCILSSAIIINFSFGFYHHLEQKKLDETINAKFLEIKFSKVVIKKGEFMNFLSEFSDNIKDHCYLSPVIVFPEDLEEPDGSMDSWLNYFILPFRYNNERIMISKEFRDNMKQNGNLIKGRYFTQEEMDNKELVCVMEDEKSSWEGEGSYFPNVKYHPDDNGKITIGGKKYTVIGQFKDYNPLPMVPITTIDDDCLVAMLDMDFDKNITRSQYQEIKDHFFEIYGDKVEIPALDLPEEDSEKFYNSLLLLCFVMVSLSGVVLSVLYEYVLLKRRKQITIYRICGMTRRKARGLYLGECILLSAGIYIVAVLLFQYGVLPHLKRAVEYIAASYTLSTYCRLGILYLMVTCLIEYGMIRRQLRDNIVTGLKEG